MPNREKVIDGLDKIREFFEARADMAVGDGKLLLLNWANAARDAAELLKGEEPVAPWSNIDVSPDGVAMRIKCGACKMELARVQEGVTLEWVQENFKYCVRCGRAVKWDG